MTSIRSFVRAALGRAALTALGALALVGALGASPASADVITTSSCSPAAVCYVVSYARNTVYYAEGVVTDAAGAVSVPTVTNPIGPGPVGPGPIGDILRRGAAAVASADYTVQQTLGYYGVRYNRPF